MNGLMMFDRKVGSFDPSTVPLRELARIRGAIWPARGPWAYGPRPGSPDNITALEYIYSYGDPSRPDLWNETQENMVKTYKSYGFTHCSFGPANAQSYHGQYPDTDFSTSPELFNTWLDWIMTFWQRGLAPAVFLHEDGTSIDQLIAKYEPLILGNYEKAKKVIRILVPTGWEPTRYDWSSWTWAKACKWARELLPDALIAIHTVSDVDAPVGSDELGTDTDNGVGWSRVAPYVHLWFIQNGPYSVSPSADPTLAKNFGGQFDPGALGAEVHGAAWHFKNAIDRWPTFSAWGDENIHCINAECTSYEAYWNNLPYSVSAAWGDLAIQSGARGYFDGGSVSVGGDTPPPWVK